MRYEGVLNPKSDIVFKRIFGTKGNEDLLEDLLSAILKEKVKCKEVAKEARIGQLKPDEKYGSLDVKVILENGKEVDLEMQLNVKPCIPIRMQCYASIMTSESLKKAKDYDEVTQKIIIFITDEIVFDSFKEPYQETELVIKKHKEYEFSDLHKYIILEIPKFENAKGIDFDIKKWIAFLNQNEEMLKSMEKDKVIKKAQRELEYLSGDEELRRLEELKFKAIVDENTNKSYYKKEGRKEEKLEMVKEMIKNGISMEIVQKVSKLTKEEIENIIEDI